MKLLNRVEKDYRDLNKRLNALFAMRKKEISQALKEFQDSCLKIVAYHLGSAGELDFIRYTTTPIEHNIRREFEMQRIVAIKRIVPVWAKSRRQACLHGRLAAGFVSRKTQPPWFPVKVDLMTPVPHTGGATHEEIILFYLKKLERLILDQIEVGIRGRESVADIIRRVRGLFSTPSHRHREARKSSTSTSDDRSDDFDMSFTVDVWDKPAVELTDGVFTADDIESLQNEQRIAMDWYYTDYSPSMDEDLWARNRAMMGFEQDLMSDVVDQVHQGLLQIGSDNMGIDDFVWVTSKPQPKCDECCDRDGLTMTQIKDQIDDKYGDKPPRLHPHCRCQIVPQIKDNWTDEQLIRDGNEWDQDTGFVPTDDQRKLGFTDMTFDQWLGDLASLKGVGARSVSA